MKKTLLAGAVTLSLGLASNASALVVDITSMDWGTVVPASGTVRSFEADGPCGLCSSSLGYMETVFFGQTLYGYPRDFYSETDVTQQFAGISPSGAFSYNFTLTQGQVAWGMFFDSGGGSAMVFVNIMDCDENNNSQIEVGERCTGIGTPMLIGPFPGQAPTFNGVVTSVVPVPAAVWLFASGLLGLMGFGRLKPK